MLTDLPVLDGRQTFSTAPLPAAPAHSRGARRFALTCSASLAALIIAMTAQPERAEAGCTAVGGTVTVAAGETCVDMRFGTAGIPSGSKLIVQQGGLVDTQTIAAISASGTGVVVGDITISGTLRGDRIDPSTGPNTIVFGTNTASIGQITFTGTANVTGEANQQAFNLFTAPLIAGIDTGGTITVTQHAWGIGSTTATTASTVNVTGDIVNRGTATTGTLGTTPRFYFDVQQATVGGSILNEVGGKILGAGDTPIRLLGTRVEKDVANKGELGAAGTAIGTGISIGRGNIASSIAGNVTNSGSIWATTTGITIADSTVAGKIENSNAITAGGSAILVSGNANTANIVNSGTIIAGVPNAGGSGIALTGTASTVGSTGSILNEKTMTISGGGNGIAGFGNWTINGNIENSADGAISLTAATGGSTGSGIRLWRDNSIPGSVTVTGDILNAGRISGAGVGINLNAVNRDAPGAITTKVVNTGTIDVSSVGFLTTVGKFTAISNEGTMKTGGSGMQVSSATVSGAVSNSGTMESNGFGIYLLGGTIGSLENSKTITLTGGGSTSAGLYTTGTTLTGGIANTAGATITAQSSATADGISVNTGTVGGNIGNAGTIQASRYGIALTDVNAGVAAPATALSNSGTITSTTGTLTAGLYATGSKLASVSNEGATAKIENATTGISLVGTTVTGAVSNTATISTTQAGIRLADNTVTGRVENGGTITVTPPAGTTGGAGIQLSGKVDTGDVVNSGTISAQLGIALTGATGTSGTTGSLLNEKTISLSNAGTGIVVTGNWTVNGNIENRAGALIEGTTVAGGSSADGIRLRSDNAPAQSIIVTGDILNAGTIRFTGPGSGSGINLTNVNRSATGTVTTRVINTGTIDVTGLGFFITGGKLASMSNENLMKTGSSGMQVSGATVSGTISNSGTIEATRIGILISSGAVGSLENSKSITVVAPGSDSLSAGIYTSGATFTGGITNTAGATITSQVTANSDGISVNTGSLGGNISNAGTINASRYGIGLTNVNTAATDPVATELLNSGTITSTTGTLTAGLFVTGTGAGTKLAAVSNASGGSITKAIDGINLSASTISGAVSNAGTIEATQNGITLTGTIASSAGSLTNSGSITAGTAGLIANDKWTINGDVANTATGKIVVTGTDADGISLTSTTLGGNVSNAGEISATRYGINLTTMNAPATELVNSGTITSTGAPLTAGLSATGSTLSAVRNEGPNGKIENAITGIALSGTTVSGAVSNSGAISATTTGIGITAASDAGSVQNMAGGTITTTGNSSDGITIADSKVGTEISNAGTISARRYGIGLTNVNVGITSPATVLKNTGTITASSGTLAAGLYATGSALAAVSNEGANARIENALNGIDLVNTDVTGTVTNSGSISASEFGIRLFGNTKTGNVVNSGTISSTTGIGLGGDPTSKGSTGSLINEGTITANGVGGGNGISVAGGWTINGNVENKAGAVITGTSSYGIRLKSEPTWAQPNIIVTGDILNAGTISGVGTGISLSGVNRDVTGNVTTRVVNTGTIDASSSGIIIGASKLASLSNENLIKAGKGFGIQVTNADVSGAVSNSGSMEAQGVGIYVDRGKIGSLENSKTITMVSQGLGSLSAGIYTSGVTVAGGITNTAGATITSQLTSKSDGISVNTGTVGGNISNAGTINASRYGIGLTNVNTAATGTVATELLNSGTITSTTGTLTAGLFVTGTGTGTKLASVRNEGVDGKILNTIDGISLAASTISGAVSNSGTIEATQNGITLAGTIASSAGSLTNSGSITAGTAGLIANDKWTINGDVANLTGGSLLGTGDGISLTGTNVTGAVGNAGTIDVDGTGIKLDGLAGPITSLVNSGTLTADATGISSTGNTITGDAGNTGTITALGDKADGILLKDTTVGGNIANDAGAIIAAARYGIGLTGTGSAKSFTNAGEITAGTASLYAESGWTINGDVANLTGGSLLGAGDGISLTGTTVTGAVGNAGTIEVGGTGIKLDGLAGTIKSLVNSGSLTANADGVLLKDTTVSGIVANDAKATIKAGGYGIGLTGTGSATSFINAGEITAGTAGLYAESGWTINGDVANLTGGSLLGTGDGISLTGTNVTGAVGNAGTIDVDGTGIKLDGLAGPITSLVNSGSLTANADGVLLKDTTVSGIVANDAKATIKAGGYGIGLTGTGSATSFMNAGEITAGTAGLYADGTWTINGDVANLSTGSLLGAGDGISLTGTKVTGAVGNAGTIDVDGIGIKLDSLAGPITSLVNSGTLTADATGISASGFDITGDTGNIGAIIALGEKADGIRLKDTTVGGVIANNGKATIAATRYGIGLTGTGSTTSFTNAGKITAGTASLYAEGTWTINGDVANLSGGSLLGAGDGIWLTNTTVTGAITNAGIIDVDGYGMWLETLGGPIKSLVNSGSMTADTSGIVSIGNAITGDAGNTGTITALGADADGILLHRSTVGGNIANDAGATIAASRYGIGLTGTGSTKSFTNSGKITAGTAGLYAEGAWTINGSVANLSGGSLLGAGDGISLTGTTVTDVLGNAGTIDVSGNGILLKDTTVGSNIANDTGATIKAGGYGIGLTGTGSAKSFINRGTITADIAGMYAEDGWTIGEVANLSSNSLLGKGDGIWFTGTTVTGDLTNTGKIDVGGNGVSLKGTTLKGKILNTGTVSAGRDGFALADAGSISLFGNLGTIIGGGSGISSKGSTRIGTLVNAQGVGNAAGGLTYSGNLPTNYHIVIDGQKYGQLFVAPDNHSGVMRFAISEDLSKGVAPRTYSTVLTGLTASDLANPDGAVWSFGKLGLLYLRLQMGSQTIWDLVMDYLPDTPKNVDDVQTATNTVFSERRAVLTTAMQYDCDRFDVRGICVELAGRATDDDGEVTGAAVVNAAVRLAEDVRLGFYVDQQLSNGSLHDATTRIQQDYNTPLLGAYLGYKANEDGTGLQARISGGYQAGRLDIRRGEMQYSEEGQDETDITAWYGFGTLGYGFSLGNSILLTPYAGLQYTDVTRDGYQEDWTAVTQYPLSYDGYHERAFTVQAGLELSGMFTEETGFEAALGLEYDVDRSANDFSGTSPIPGFENFSFDQDEDEGAKLRPAGMMSLFHNLTPTQRISATVTAGQDAWSEDFQGSALVAYKFSF